VQNDCIIVGLKLPQYQSACFVFAYSARQHVRSTMLLRGNSSRNMPVTNVAASYRVEALHGRPSAAYSTAAVRPVGWLCRRCNTYVMRWQGCATTSLHRRSRIEAEELGAKYCDSLACLCLFQAFAC
jgi:hypothetical protein